VCLLSLEVQGAVTGTHACTDRDSRASRSRQSPNFDGSVGRTRPRRSPHPYTLRGVISCAGCESKLKGSYRPDRSVVVALPSSTDEKSRGFGGSGLMLRPTTGTKPKAQNPSPVELTLEADPFSPPHFWGRARGAGAARPAQSRLRGDFGGSRTVMSRVRSMTCWATSTRRAL
jgi:hypothetical protein